MNGSTLYLGHSIMTWKPQQGREPWRIPACFTSIKNTINDVLNKDSIIYYMSYLHQTCNMLKNSIFFFSKRQSFDHMTPTWEARLKKKFGTYQMLSALTSFASSLAKASDAMAIYKHEEIPGAVRTRAPRVSRHKPGPEEPAILNWPAPAARNSGGPV